MSGLAAQIRKARADGRPDKALHLKNLGEEYGESILEAIEGRHEYKEPPYYSTGELAEAVGLSHGYLKQIISFMHSDECDLPEVFFDFYKEGKQGVRCWHTELTDDRKAAAWKSHVQHAAICKDGVGQNQRGNFTNVLEGNKLRNEKKKSKSKGGTPKLAAKPTIREQAAAAIVIGVEKDPLAPIMGQVAGVLSAGQMAGARTALTSRAKQLTTGKKS